MTERTFCIIGAGPCGLALARAFRKAGIRYDHVERHSDVGGIWDIDNPGSPMYRSAHFISSKTQSHFLGFPMTADYPDYPSNTQILAYLRSFARTFGLYDHIRFGVGVVDVQQVSGGWQVAFSDGETRTYAGVICATGTNWEPQVPRFEGEFSGDLRHSVTYTSPDEFRGKKVLIVGAGNSGCDIACDAARNASAAFISMRRGYHFIPKRVFGQPSDAFAANGPHLPAALERPIMQGLLRLLVGDLTRVGLPKPDHRLFESHPIMNDQLIHHLAHGDIRVKPDVERFDGLDVVFRDGTREAIDVVICATGYTMNIPYARRYFQWKSERPELYLTIFNREHHNLFGLGYLETDGALYDLADWMAHLLTRYLLTQAASPDAPQPFDTLIRDDRTDLSGGPHVDSPRHALYVQRRAYLKHLRALCRRVGWPEPDAHALAVPVTAPRPLPGGATGQQVGA
ncbi:MULTISPECIES: flavin-containing monooxygenase [Deinococcus]|uniref:Flavin-containing monooxygenase n=1 Tax=Deinococcus rufus TaxID=2136097 RepID=A0ABV7Z7R5_9DEIO|nr:NAD(P)-binding domain-containing protein [Deinococcus sp. AB2017081]WQE96211.1 NAD(P)-binding domain-containing protein [Deinococcus sp. AB2017081]